MVTCVKTKFDNLELLLLNEKQNKWFCEYMFGYWEPNSYLKTIHKLCSNKVSFLFGAVVVGHEALPHVSNSPRNTESLHVFPSEYNGLPCHPTADEITC